MEMSCGATANEKIEVWELHYSAFGLMVNRRMFSAQIGILRFDSSNAEEFGPLMRVRILCFRVSEDWRAGKDEIWEKI